AYERGRKRGELGAIRLVGDACPKYSRKGVGGAKQRRGRVAVGPLPAAWRAQKRLRGVRNRSDVRQTEHVRFAPEGVQLARDVLELSTIGALGAHLDHRERNPAQPLESRRLELAE